MQNLLRYFKEHDGYLWLAFLLVVGGVKLYPTLQDKFLNPCKDVYQEVRATETELQKAIISRNSAVSDFFQLEDSSTDFWGNDNVGEAYTKLLESDDPVYEKRDIVYRLVSMEPKCFSRTDVITSAKEIKNYEDYLEREASNTGRPIYLPGFLKESDFPQWSFVSVIPEGK